MLKTLLAGTALASLLALGAQGQEAPAEPETTPPAAVENELPSATSEEPAAPDNSRDGGTTPARNPRAGRRRHPTPWPRNLPARRAGASRRA